LRNVTLPLEIMGVARDESLRRAAKYLEMVGLNGFEPGQSHALHAHTGMDKMYYVIEGDGLFGVETAAGPRYTRSGNFKLDEARDIVTADGMKVRGQGGQPIAVPPNAQAISVGSDGTVSADGQVVGKLELVKFAPNQLKREGGSLFAATGQPATGEAPKLHAGMLEGSNVNVVRGVVDLVMVSRTYESLMRVIQNYHDVESRAARDLGGPK
jgi:flagellar basal-body rod protein FlgF